MNCPNESQPTRLELVPALPNQEQVLANLFELYAHDFSEFHDVEIGADGRFGYRDLPLYWSEPGRHPFLATLNDKLAGFVLVKQGSRVSDNRAVWDMAEFFVMRAYRRHGIGTALAHKVWNRFPGAWEVRVMRSNRHACSFWQAAIRQFIGRPARAVRVENDGEPWNVFTFVSPPQE
jgi:predicted acetyltransferase